MRGLISASQPVPHAPPAVRGLVPLHGQALPLLDLGPHLAPGGDPLGSTLLRAEGSRILLIETTLPDDGTLVRAALMVDRVTRLGTVAEEHARPAPPNAPFVAATVLDVEGPALLIDAAGALDAVRACLRQTVQP